MKKIKQVKHSLIFIVEDNDIYSVMLDYLLSQEINCNFSNFPDGETCLRNLDQHPDIVILDQRLPGLSGLETLRKIKAVDPAIPVVIISANDDAELAKQAIDEGAYDFIVKGKDAVRQLRFVIEGLLKDEPAPVNKKSNKLSSLLHVLKSVF